MNSEAKELAQLNSLRAERDRLEGQLRCVKASFSYRLGNTLVEAVCRPGRSTILLPYRLVLLWLSHYEKREAASAARCGRTLSTPAGPALNDLRQRLSGATIEAWFRSADYSGIRTFAARDRDLRYANQALDGVMHIASNLEPYHYRRGIDWGAERGRSRTWRLYFHSLMVVGYLANAAEVSRDVRYLEKAGAILESWLAHQFGIFGSRDHAWRIDHAVSNRVFNIVHFLRACSVVPDVRFTESFFEKVGTMLRRHGNWLLDERNYSPGNHGLMASMALTQLALIFPEMDCDGAWKGAGMSRVRERIREDLSAENVHLEHSAAYHIFFLTLVRQADDFLKERGVTLFESGDETVEGMKQYAAYLVKPDRCLPMIGDTSDSRLPRHYDHPWVIYSLSEGQDGVRPPACSMVYPDAGVAILRDDWRKGSDFCRTTYLMVQASFTYHIGHKHADDLGFVLYSRGEDIFVGPGVYAYDSSKYRLYVRSAQAHNTVTVDGQSYAISPVNVGKAAITACSLDEAFDFVQGSHTMYDGVTLRRGIVFVRPSTILVIDEAVSQAEHSVQQIWNLSSAARDLQFDSRGASWFVGENGVSVEIRQIRPTEVVNHYYGQDEPVRGFISPRQRELVPIHQLEFENHGDGVVFVTQISVTGQGEDAPSIEVNLDDPYRGIVVRHKDGTILTIDLDPAVVKSDE